MKLLKMGAGDEVRWLVAKTSEGYLYAYVPNTGRWHRLKALEHDYYVDQEGDFTPIDAAEARDLMKARVGRVDGRSRGWLLAELQQDQQASETDTILP